MGKYGSGDKTQAIGIVDSYAFHEDGSVPTLPEGLKTLEHRAGMVVVVVGILFGLIVARGREESLTTARAGRGRMGTQQPRRPQLQASMGV
jgi:hypothetical protein